MPEELQLNDTLPNGLQSAIDHKLVVGEAILMSLNGAAGEGLVVTDRRVVILREQMPIAGAAEVDCFDYTYEQVRDVRVEESIGSSHILLDLTTPPLDDKAVTLCFPSYEIARFDAAAARIRLLARHASAVPLPGQQPSGSLSLPLEADCSSCGAPLEDSKSPYCAACGAPQGAICTFCLGVVKPGAKYCSRCGVSAEHAQKGQCAACGAAVRATFVYCPQCGRSQRARCGRCGGTVELGWRRCAYCGQALESVGVLPMESTCTPGGKDGESDLDESPAAHNARGRTHYNEERYDEAVEAFRAAVGSEPQNPQYHCNLGAALAEVGRDDAALQEFDMAMRIAPNDPAAYLNLGYFHSERDRDDEARAAWNRVLELAPNSPEADEARENLLHLDEV